MVMRQPCSQLIVKQSAAATSPSIRQLRVAPAAAASRHNCSARFVTEPLPAPLLAGTLARTLQEFVAAGRFCLRLLRAFEQPPTSSDPTPDPWRSPSSAWLK